MLVPVWSAHLVPEPQLVENLMKHCTVVETDLGHVQEVVTVLSPDCGGAPPLFWTGDVYVVVVLVEWNEVYARDIGCDVLHGPVDNGELVIGWNWLVRKEVVKRDEGATYRTGRW